MKMKGRISKVVAHKLRKLMIPEKQLEIEEKEGVLKQIPALACLEDEHLDAVVDEMQFKIYDEDDSLIIEEGQRLDRLYVVVSGVVAIMSTSEHGWPVERGKK